MNQEHASSPAPAGKVSVSVTMPVYNESAGIGVVIADVIEHVLDVVPGSELVVVDDHSTDDTLRRLQEAAALDPRITVLHNEVNSGHGRSLRRAMDASTGEWIFHLDSDGQVDVSEFDLLWSRAAAADLVLGMRITRHDPLHRLVLTRLTRGTVSLLARRRIRDANVPFKLIRRDLYEHLLPAIPTETFAPSILIVLGAYRCGARVVEVETTHLPRVHGRSTLRLQRLAAAVLRTTLQTLSFSRCSLAPYERN